MKPKTIVPKITRTAQCRQLFAGPYPISEYMDNISRVGQVIMNDGLNCHEHCTKNRCKHKFIVDLNKPPKKKNQIHTVSKFQFQKKK